MQSELDIQKETTQRFGQIAPNLVATVSDKLGNVTQYEKIAFAKEYAEKLLTKTTDANDKTELEKTIKLATEYLSANQASYHTWKEGGIGRALLQAGVGGLMTGHANGALAGGSTSLAAPYLNTAEEKLGGTGALINALGGAAIGYATGGSGGAVVGANVDWNNRQLHQSERDWIRKNAQAFAKQEAGGREPSTDEIALAEKRLAQQAAKETDLLWMLTLEKVTDLSAQKFLRQAKGTFTNENGEQQQLFTTQGKQFTRPEIFADIANIDLSFYKQNLHSAQNTSISKGASDLAQKFATSAWKKAKEDPFLTGLKVFAAPVHLATEVGKDIWNCASHLGNCIHKGAEHVVETSSAIATGAASLKLDDLKSIYGQNVRGAQAGLIALQTVDGVASRSLHAT